MTLLFAGSFNPFTKGHLSIVSRALSFADRIVVAVGVNPGKEDEGIANLAEIRRIFEDNPRVDVVEYSGLTVEFARAAGADALLRGVRSVKDYEYELGLADTNRDISGLETILLPAEPALSFVSSSMVRELRSHGIDVGRYLP